MTSFVSELSTACVQKGLIDSENVPWFEYGIKVRITTIVSLIPFALLAIKLSDIPTTLAFLAAFKSLRTCAGGYHANSVLGCIVVSLILELFFLGVFLRWLNPVTFYISSAVSTVVIYFLSPFVPPNMNASKEEIGALRSCAKRKAVGITVIAIACYHFHFNTIAEGLTTGTTMVAFMLCLAYFIEWRNST